MLFTGSADIFLHHLVLSSALVDLWPNIYLILRKMAVANLILHVCEFRIRSIPFIESLPFHTFIVSDFHDVTVSLDGMLETLGFMFSSWYGTSIFSVIFWA